MVLGRTDNSTNFSMSEFFHYPVGKSKEYSRLRQTTTDRYGVITTAVMVSFLIAIPVQNLLVVRGYTLSRKVPLFKMINSYLNNKIRGSAAGEIGADSTTTTARHATQAQKFAIKLKQWIYLVYYHSSGILIVLFWGVVLTALTLGDCYHGDLIFIAKRLGRIANNCLPTVLFLSLRPSPLPQTLYLVLLPIHKWLSRLIILQSVLHTMLYCGFFQKNQTWPKAWKADNLYGWAALGGFIVIVITSLSQLRNRLYKLFYINHYLWTWVIVVCLQFHVRPTKATNYTVINLLILTGQIAYRLRLTRITSTKYDLKVIDVSPNLAYIEFPNHLIANRAISPGAHIRLTKYHNNFFMRVFKQIIPNYHPYTLVSLPSDNYQKLIIRKSSFQFKNYHKYIIYGSFDPHLLFIKPKPTKLKSRNKKQNDTQFSISRLAINAKKILVVVGGSAISFALPILRVMNYHGVRIKIVWVIKDFRDISILKFFDGFIHDDDFEIFVTGDVDFSTTGSSNHTRVSSTDLEDQSGELQPLLREEDEGEEPSSHSTSNFNSVSGSSSYAATSTSSLSRKNVIDPHSAEHQSLNHENETENVEISIDNGDEEEDDNECDDCAAHDSTIIHDSFLQPQSILNAEEFEDDDLIDGLSHSSPQGSDTEETQSRKTHVSSQTNEAFLPELQSFRSSGNLQIEQFKETVKKLHLESRIYKGRPKLNYRYFNWCVNEEDIFTQCSGPVKDAMGNAVICCRDLPQRNRIGGRGDAKLTPDASRSWVVSAGPPGLIKNVKLWANENGLKFHEEAFYV